jgi:uncharacterized protein
LRLFSHQIERKIAMTETRQSEIAELLAPMIKMVLYVAFSRAVATSSEMLPYVAEHLRYMNGLEEQGMLFGSGPCVQEGVAVGDGLTILRAETIDEAKKLMENEPLIKRGMRSFEIRRWELREGRISIKLNASSSTFELG